MRTGRLRGRRTKYNPATVKLICRLVARGLNYHQAADAAGIHRDTLNDWENTKSEFSDALKRAKAEGISRRLERIERAARNGHWQADAWWLERVYPEQFGRRAPIDWQSGHADEENSKTRVIMLPAFGAPKPPPDDALNGAG